MAQVRLGRGPAGRPGRSGAPGYIRPRPRAVWGLPATAWTAVICVAAAGLVELVCRLGWLSRADIVPPTEMVARAVGLLGEPPFTTVHLLPTIALIFETFVTAAVVGIGLGYCVWRWRWVRRAVQPYLNVYYAIPVFAVYPILVVLFGIGDLPIVLISVGFGMVVIVTHTVNGFDAVPVSVKKLARSRRLSRWRYFHSVLIPSALPEIAAGLLLGLVYATLAVLGTQFILATQGLGHFIADAYHTFEIADMYAGVVLIIALSLLLNVVAAAVLTRVDWRRR